jgi:hypothetical protein
MGCPELPNCFRKHRTSLPHFYASLNSSNFSPEPKLARSFQRSVRLFFAFLLPVALLY